MARKTWSGSPSTLLRVGPGFDLTTFDKASTPGWTAGEDEAVEYLESVAEELSDLQERLFAEAKHGGNRSILLVLQGMDTSGKGGILRHVLGLVDPQGIALSSFGVPTAEERKHHYLWRIRRALPKPGRIGVFDRSHYEDVLVVRVDSLVTEDVWGKRYDEINKFEEKVVADGTIVIKCALLVSYAEQTERLTERLERADKHWKYNPGDVDARMKWPAYREAYQAVFDRTSTDTAPWYAIPADNKWYSRLAITELLLETLRGMDLTWPEATFDVEAEKVRLAATARPDWLEAAEADVVAAKQKAKSAEAKPAAKPKADARKKAAAGKKAAKSEKEPKKAKTSDKGKGKGKKDSKTSKKK